MSKLIVVSAASGTGKSTIVARLQENAKDLKLQFSISATSRKPRGAEQNGKEYYFLTKEDFERRIANDEFIEYEEVYSGSYYGTLKSEIQRISNEGGNVIFDLDCVGGQNIKKLYGDDALLIFILPPSLEALRQRLEGRATDSPEVIEQRLAKAEEEIAQAKAFDFVVVNDDLDECCEAVETEIRKFLGLNK